MTDLEYYRINRLLPQLRKLEKEYPHKSLGNIIQNLEARLDHHRTARSRKPRQPPPPP